MQCARVFAGFSSSLAGADCKPSDETEYYALLSDASDLKQYYMSYASLSDVAIGQRGVDYMDVDAKNRLVYFLDQSLNTIKVRLTPSRYD